MLLEKIQHQLQLSPSGSSSCIITLELIDHGTVAVFAAIQLLALLDQVSAS
jgi:hypothetical protein